MDGATQKEVILAYLPMCRRIAYTVARRLPHSVDVEDLVHIGVLGLYDALRLYDTKMGAFAPYAQVRIRGAILDQLRKDDHIKKNVREKIKEVAHAKRQLAAKLGRAPTSLEVATALGIEQRDYLELVNELAIPSIVSIEELSEESGVEPTDEGALGENDIAERFDRPTVDLRLREAIEQLPPRQRHAVTEVLIKGRALASVSIELGVTPSRVSQICTKAVQVLRRKMRKK